MSHERLDIRTFRELRNLTQEELASIVGVSLSTIQRCERDGRLPATRLVRNAIMEALGIEGKE